jgi:hypothetical protein
MSNRTATLNSAIDLYPGFRCLGISHDHLDCPHFVLEVKTFTGRRTVLLSFKDAVSDNAAKTVLAASGYLNSNVQTAVKRLRAMADKGTKLAKLIVADDDGWYDNGRTYLFGGNLVGQPKRKIILLSRTKPSFREVDTETSLALSGTTRDWRQGTRQAIKRSDLLLCSVSFGFAAPLLSQLKERSWLVHFYGAAGSGKTLALVVVRSLFGNPTALPTWHTTTVGFNDALRGASDAPFVCDELTYLDKQSDAAQNLSKITYSVDSNQGKSTSKRSSSYDGGALRRGRTIVLSNGEISLAQIYGQTNQKRRKGEQRRAFDIAIDASQETGIFSSLPTGTDFRQFCRELASACSQNYGLPGHCFISHLISSRKEWPDRVRAAAAEFADSVDASGHHLAREHAERFGIAFAAGLEARRCGLIKCSKSRMKKVLRHFYQRSAHVLTTAEVTSKGVLKSLRQSLKREKHVYAFEKAKKRMPDDAIALCRKDPDEFLVLPSYLEKLCGGSKHTMQQVAKVLRERGHLRLGSNGSSTDQVSGIHGRRERFYRIKTSFLKRTDVVGIDGAKETGS